MIRPGRIRKSIWYSSGRLAVRVGMRVFIEVYNETVWVYQEMPGQTQLRNNLLYTFRSKEEARKHLVYTE